jgi:hypothetical protein
LIFRRVSVEYRSESFRLRNLGLPGKIYAALFFQCCVDMSRNQYYRELVNNNSNTSYIQTLIGNKELVRIVNMVIATRDAN